MSPVGSPVRGKPWIEVGDDHRVAYVFSCPGSVERKKNRPAAGATGHALAIVVALVQGWGFKSLPLRDVCTVTNAWPEFEHKLLRTEEGTGRTEAILEQVLTEPNLSRLETELKPVTEWILCFGWAARETVPAVKKRGNLSTQVRIAHTGHLSANHLKAITTDRYGKAIPVGEPGSRFKQLERVAWDLWRSIQENGWRPRPRREPSGSGQPAGAP